MRCTEKLTARQAELVAPKRILLATDLTDGDFLIPHAVAQARASGAAVTVLHAILPSETLPLDAHGGMGCAGSVSGWMGSEEETRLRLEAMCAEIESAGVKCDSVARHGLPADVLQDEIEKGNATRLIMASHGRGKWGQLLMGSVANQLLGRIQIPAFVVGPKSAGCPQHETLRKILHPVSLNGNYRQGIHLALALASTLHAELTLLHVVDRDIESSIPRGGAQNWAENLFSTSISERIGGVAEVEVQVAFGNVVDEIRQEAAHICADWIVLGIDDGYPLWPLQGSFAYKVMAVASCPVLAIPSVSMQSETAAAEERQGVFHRAAGLHGTTSVATI